MAEQTFKSPGFFEREIEIINRPLVSNNATPVGIVGPAEKGPAFVPTTVSSESEFYKIFGNPDRHRYPSHAISEFFKEGGKAATFCRVLGGGKGKAADDGTTKFAGFKIEGTKLVNDTTRATGAVQFLLANHELNLAEHLTLGIFNDNDSHTTALDSDPAAGGIGDAGDGMTDRLVQIVRAVFFLKSGFRLSIGDDGNDVETAGAAAADKTFTLKVKDSGDNNVSEFTVSLDPASDKYITKQMNTDPLAFSSTGYLLYADFPIDDEVASTASQDVALAIGDAKLNDYGNFACKYEAPKTTSFISQPFGVTEYDLFSVESIDDGSYASGKYKVSIVNLKASTEKNYKYGTFGLQLRDLNDTDDNVIVYESYNNLSLDPDASNYIAKVIGDQKIYLNLETDNEDEKRLVKEGTYENKSTRIRVVMSDDVINREVPENALPFGFRGIPALYTTEDGTDTANQSLLTGNGVLSNAVNAVGNAILPPLPYRLKTTRGKVSRTAANGSDEWFQTYLGHAENNGEVVKTYFYWGLMNTKVKSITDPNNAGVSDISPLVANLTKFMGALRGDTGVVKLGEKADSFNNNKFSLSKIAFAANALLPDPNNANNRSLSDSIIDAFKEAVYVRNADVTNSKLYDTVNHLIKMTGSNDPFDLEDNSADPADVFATRVSLAKLLAEDPEKFNRFSLMTKFTAPFYGGFDGVNILDEEDYYFTDRSSSQATSADSADSLAGHASPVGYISGLSATSAADPEDSLQGYGLDNNIVTAYRNGIKLLTDEMVSNVNVLVVPGIRDSIITDYAVSRVKEYGKAIYLMDMPHHDKDGLRIFTGITGVTSGRPDVVVTSNLFYRRELNSSYTATYFPDVSIEDSGDVAAFNKRSIKIPSSIVALGALARTDVAGTPWFAPAGFSRGSLSRVKNLDVRLSASDRDILYESRINPIANFPNNQFVIFGQKTTQIAKTALDRVNVRRLMIRIKSDIQKIAQGLLFEQNDAVTRKRFIDQSSTLLQRIRIGQGIEDFRVIMDETNNSEEDVDNNRLNGRIIVVPTRAIEYIAMDFVITNSGVEFPA